jgi:hypothetical protein
MVKNMVEDQLTRNKNLLILKGVPIEEEEPKVDAELILQQYKNRQLEKERQIAELDQLEIDILKLLKQKMEKAT